MTLMSAPRPHGPNSLDDFSGVLVLVGAGKMGAAMLQGWLGLGLDPAKVAVIEPQPSLEVAALSARGLRLNPPSGTVRNATAIIVAVKPQSAAEVMPGLG